MHERETRAQRPQAAQGPPGGSTGGTAATPPWGRGGRQLQPAGHLIAAAEPPVASNQGKTHYTILQPSDDHQDLNAATPPIPPSKNAPPATVAVPRPYQTACPPTPRRQGRPWCGDGLARCSTGAGGQKRRSAAGGRPFRWQGGVATPRRPTQETWRGCPARRKHTPAGPQAERDRDFAIRVTSHDVTHSRARVNIQ